MSTSNLFFLLFNITFLFIAVEYVYSHFKKDGVYSFKGTIGNLLNGLILRIVSTVCISACIVYFINIHTQLSYNFKPSILLFIVCLTLVDLMYYIFHITHHSVSQLWILHSVHHGDDKFNLSTAYRISWVEQIYIMFFFLPVVLVGFHPIVVLICYNILSLYQFLCHSQYIKFPKFMNYIFITPTLHKVHHDQETKHHNSNFGGIFNVWDRMFGTYVSHLETFTPGIKGYKQDNFIKMETDPVVGYLRSFNKNK